MSVVEGYMFEGWCEKNSYNGAVRRGCDGHVFYGARCCASRFSDACQIARKDYHFIIVYQISEILLHFWQRISIIIVSHRQMTNIVTYHRWSSFVCGYWVSIWSWKIDSSWRFPNFTYISSLLICQSYGLTASPKHSRITLKMHCIRLTRKWHVGLKHV